MTVIGCVTFVTPDTLRDVDVAAFVVAVRETAVDGVPRDTPTGIVISVAPVFDIAILLTFYKQTQNICSALSGAGNSYFFNITVPVINNCSLYLLVIA